MFTIHQTCQVVNKASIKYPVYIYNIDMDINMQPTQTLVCLLRLGYLDELAVPSAVQLGPGAPHSGPFAVVQHGEVHPRPVSCPPHQAVQGIHLPHQLPLPHPAQGRVTGQGACGGQGEVQLSDVQALRNNCSLTLVGSM